MSVCIVRLQYHPYLGICISIKRASNVSFLYELSVSCPLSRMLTCKPPESNILAASYCLMSLPSAKRICPQSDVFESVSWAARIFVLPRLSIKIHPRSLQGLGLKQALLKYSKKGLMLLCAHHVHR